MTIVYRIVPPILMLSLSACGFDSHEVRQWVLPAKHQSIDTNFDHWIPFAFTEGNLTVTLKIPPDSRSLHVETLPESAYDKSARRRLLDVGGAASARLMSSTRRLNVITVYVVDEEKLS